MVSSSSRVHQVDVGFEPCSLSLYKIAIIVLIENLEVTLKCETAVP